jgi:hypothetical protein
MYTKRWLQPTRPHTICIHEGGSSQPHSTAMPYEQPCGALGPMEGSAHLVHALIVEAVGPQEAPERGGQAVALHGVPQGLQLSGGGRIPAK